MVIGESREMVKRRMVEDYSKVRVVDLGQKRQSPEGVRRPRSKRTVGPTRTLKHRRALVENEFRSDMSIFTR